jgi:hypothetical protein
MSKNGNRPGEGAAYSVGDCDFNATEPNGQAEKTQASSSIGNCQDCGTHTALMPLHGPRGGPLRCPLCIGKWNAEHGRKRRLGRIVVRAMIAFMDAGGTKADLVSLQMSAVGINLAVFFGRPVDPLGYLEGSAQIGGEEIELTSELLADAIKLAHPDCHPPEREDLARRTTQGLLALQPFTFPKPKPKPSLGEIFRRNGSSTSAAKIETAVTKGPTYPCADCKSTIPKYYCTACRSEWEKRLAQEEEQSRANQRKWYARRKARRWKSKPCAECGAAFTVSGGSGKYKRADARFCSDACRQRAHRKAVTAKTKSSGEHLISRDKAAAAAPPDPAAAADADLPAEAEAEGRAAQ